MDQGRSTGWNKTVSSEVARPEAADARQAGTVLQVDRKPGRSVGDSPCVDQSADSDRSLQPGIVSSVCIGCADTNVLDGVGHRLLSRDAAISAPRHLETVDQVHTVRDE